MSETPAIRAGCLVLSALWFGVFGLLLILDRTAGSSPGLGLYSYILSFVMLAGTVMVSAWALSERWADRAGVLAALVGVLILVAALVSPLEVAMYGLIAGYALLLVCGCVGALIGRRIEDAAYLWPLTIVMVSFDLWSVFAAAGVTQELVIEPTAEVGRALLVLSFPVPGLGVQPVLGIGDVIVVSLFYSAVHWLGLSLRRLTFGLSIGFGLCLMALFLFQVPLPALAFIAPSAVIALGDEAKPRMKELMIAAVFCAIGLSLLHLIRS